MPDTVETFTRISWLIFKLSLYALLVLVGLTTAVVAIVYAYRYYSFDRHVAKVEFMISAKRGTRCTDEKHPIFVGVVNRSGRTIEKVDFTLKASRPDRSSNVLRYH